MPGKYVDLDALISKLNKRYRELEGECGFYDHYTNGYDEAIDAVESFPFVDAVPVVRCKDCRHRGEGDVCPMISLLWCEEEGYFYSDFTMDDYYCSFGERKDNHETD